MYSTVIFPLAADNIAQAEAEYNDVQIQHSIDTDKVAKRFAKLGLAKAQHNAVKFYAVDPTTAAVTRNVRDLAIICMDISYANQPQILADAINAYYDNLPKAENVSEDFTTDDQEPEELTGDNAIDYDLTTVEGILHALRNGRYLGGPAETKNQCKALRAKLRKLGHKVSEAK